jgi:phospholipase A1
LLYNNIEAKFQLSFKTKVLQGVFWGMVIYGCILKSPIGKSIIIIFPPLEVNYEPELILNFPVKFNLFGFKARMVGAALIMNRMEK